MNMFDHIESFPPDPVLGIANFYKKDPNPNKVDLTAGVYRNKHLKSEIMTSVKKAEALLLEREMSKSYLPQGGSVEFIEESKKLLFGEELAKKCEKHIVGAQSIGGTGTLRLGGEFLAEMVSNNLFLSDPTWPNHPGVFEACKMNIASYPYYNRSNGKLDCAQLLDYLDQLQEKSIIVLHVCCHNPTGCDPTQEEWKAIEEKIAKRRLIPFFDIAYLGFSKTITEDSWVIRHFINKGHEFLVSLAFSKSFSLYAERVGVLFIHYHREKEKGAIESILKHLIRVNYSNSPVHGSSIVSLILQDKALRKEWEEELLEMRCRVDKMRTSFLDGIATRLGSDAFDSLRHHHGFFSLLPLTEGQIERLMNKHSIYMIKNGRINLAGLSEHNLNRVIDALVDVYTHRDI